MAVAAGLKVLNDVVRVAESTLRMPSGKLDVDAAFDSFGIDSIIAVELITNLSKEFSISISPAQFSNVNTVRQLSDLIEGILVPRSNAADAKPVIEKEYVKPAAQPAQQPATQPYSNVRAQSVKRHRTRANSVSFQPILDHISQKYSIDLADQKYHSIDEIAEALVSNHFDALMLHYGITQEPAVKESKIEKTNHPVVEKGAEQPRTIQDVAIVGISCRFPDAPNSQKFWDNLITQKNSIREIPKSRWNWEEYYADSIAPQKTISKWGAFIDDIDCFDSHFFKITPQEARLMDPQERLLMQEVYNAFQDAGIDMDKISGSNTGIFIGYEYSEYEQYLRKNSNNIQDTPLFSSSSPTYYLANRLSYIFNLCGPSESININCASSAVAINRAYYSLLNNESSLAVAGGVCLNLFADDYIAQSQYGILSSNGTCSVFDDNANGFTRGEGVAAVILKRLDDAKRDNNKIYAIIKSCHQNNRGYANSISDVKHEPFTNVIKDCYEKASISPEAINYIEVDGYSTKWADSFEFEGIKNAFKNGESKEKYCALGSLKGNIGHLEPASGIASIIKVALSLRNKKFPATITKKTLNEFIDIKNSSHPLYIADTAISFENIRKNKYTPIRAGVNSFADSGVNVHILLEEYIPETPTTNSIISPIRQLFILSAKDRFRLVDYVHEFVDFLSAADADVPFTNMTSTLQMGRQHMEERLAIISSSKNELLEKLSLVKNSDLLEQPGLVKQGIYSGNIEQTRKNPLASLFTKDMSTKYVENGLQTEQWQQIALLWINGVSIPWEKVWEGKTVQQVSLPGYPFAKERYWIDLADHGGVNVPEATTDAVKEPTLEPKIEFAIEPASEPPTQAEWEFSMSSGDTKHSGSMGSAKKIELFLKQQIALQLEKPIQEITTVRDFLELGMNSIGIANLFHDTNQLLQENISLHLVFQYSDIEKLTEYLVATYPEKINALVITKQKKQANTESSSTESLPEQTNSIQLASSASESEESHIPPMLPINRAEFDRFPLSYAQERLWFINQLEPDSSNYNIPIAFTISGELDIDHLEHALNLIIARHENLRTIFPNQEGQAQQLILDSFEFKLARIDLSDYETSAQSHNQAKQLCQNEAATPFDLARGPLIRGKIIKLMEQEHILMLTMHHIISDDWSIGVLLKELFLIMDALRQGKSPNLAPLPIQYIDYSVWQRKWLEQGGILKQQLSYWQAKLAGVPESLNLVTDYPRPSVQSFAGAIHKFTLDVQLTERLKSLTKQQRCTLFMTLLAAFKVLLYRYTDQEDICIGIPIANRQYGETEGLIGMFVNTLALRSLVKGEDTFIRILAKVKTTCLEAYDHQDAPFEKIVDLVQPQRNMAINPLFQIAVALRNARMEALDEHIQPYPLDRDASIFDLTVEFTEIPEGLKGLIEYSTALYKQQTIERMVKHFIALCQAIVTRPTAKISELDYIGEAEKKQLLIDFNDTQADYPKDKCIHQLFAEQVAINPNKTAVVYEDEQLTYQQLYDKSHDLALYLQSLGVKPDSLVGLCVERSLDMLVGMLGILQAGGAYVPLDPDYPDERLTYMLQDSQAAIVLTQEKLQDKLSALVSKETQLVALDLQWSEISDCAAELKAKKVKLSQEVKPHHLAYVIYTSGSTGKPKGVMVEHRALMNRIDWMQKLYALNKDDIVLQKTPFSFDVSVWEFVWPMMSGAYVVFAIPDGHKDVRYLEDLINKKKITTLHFVPSMINTYLNTAKTSCNSVKQIFCSGEALGSESVNNYKTKFPHALLYNLYGPTEAAIDVTAYDCSQLNCATVPIGTPIANIQIYIVDQHRNPLPIGIPGELHIAGDGLARGYLNRPELTRKKFIANPFNPGTRMYKSGDLARWLDDGNIEYLGRIDTQVKIHGFRIELGEIESAVKQHPAIRDSATIFNKKVDGLVAYGVLDNSITPAAYRIASMLDEAKTIQTNDLFLMTNGMEVCGLNKAETEFVYDEIFNHRCYDRHGITVKEGDCVFDVGANIGMFSIYLTTRVDNLCVYSFEPISTIYEVLEKNSQIYGDGKIIPHCLGLSDSQGESEYDFYPNNSLVSGVDKDETGVVETVKKYLFAEMAKQQSDLDISSDAVEELLQERLRKQKVQVSLSTVSHQIREHKIRSLALLKVDVERSELDVLNGIEDKDWEKIEQIIVEVHATADNLAKVQKLLKSHGYNVITEQDEALGDTELYNVYARRNTNGKSLPEYNSHRWVGPASLRKEVQQHLEEQLPAYMIPMKIVFLSKLPLTPNGKVDRRALERVDVSLESSQAYQAPHNDMEKQLVDIWAQVLNLEPEKIGVNDNYFELGGNSLLVMRLLAKIETQLKQSLPVSILFTAGTIKTLAKVILDKMVSFDILVPMQKKGNKPPIFALPGGDGGMLPLLPLSRALGNNQPFYGLQAVGFDGKTPPLDSIEKTAKVNIPAMKSIQATGPYTLLGYSNGGVVAFEMARILLDQGEKIASLILLDSLVPELQDDDQDAETIRVLNFVGISHGLKFNLDIEQLKEVPKSERRDFLFKVITDGGYVITRNQFDVTYDVVMASDDSCQKYRTPKLSHKIDVDLYRADDTYLKDLPDDNGWNEFLLNPIRIFGIVANHFTLVREGPVQEVAKSIMLTV